MTKHIVQDLRDGVRNREQKEHQTPHQPINFASNLQCPTRQDRLRDDPTKIAESGKKKHLKQDAKKSAKQEHKNKRSKIWAFQKRLFVTHSPKNSTAVTETMIAK